MPIAVRSFAKINLGLRIGRQREDGFHELRTIYQTIALHDVIRVEVARGSGIEIRCKNPRVPQDESNTCYRMAERVLRAAKLRGKIIIQIEKNLPVQGGLGAASSNACAVLLGLERALKTKIPAQEKLRMGVEVGSDVPLFLLGGTVLGMGRGEEVYPLDDLPAMHGVVVMPEVGISTPKAFADWDELCARNPDEGAGDQKNAQPRALRLPLRQAQGSAAPRLIGQASVPHRHERSKLGRLTQDDHSDTLKEFSQSMFVWLGGNHTATGVSIRDGGRVEAPLLDLVRAGIENDFERVVFPQHPELRGIKRVLEEQGAKYASLSGSGSVVYGLFVSKLAAERAAKRLTSDGMKARAMATLERAAYWKTMFKSDD